ncbi:serine hydrolase domain-containing protein [Paenibacillus silvisoli]|uniref:serine hydrolase domain-containing protein n=1 Tax=Paenibacillus silvisoli TaxID=3110539 RepID=UPI002806103F|nr:serine hydrolase [Paenibacillus silvisoli]
METRIGSSPEDAGMDAAKLALIFDEVEYGKFKETHGIYAVRNGVRVFESYFYPYSAEKLHNLYSVTKSLTSALIGIAIKQGLIEGVHQKALDFFPEIAALQLDPRKHEITLEHLLTMTPGFEWEDEDSLKAGMKCEDWNRHMFEQPLGHEPGTTFTYNSGCSYMLLSILHRVAGISTTEFAERYLFGPLGISDYYWCTCPKGVLIGGFGALLKPADMVKLGQLYLNGGEWNGQRIVTEEWVRESTIKRTENGYGYHWWVIEEERRYAAAGYGGNFIHVVPDLKLVVAVTNGGGNELPVGMFSRAIVSDEPLPANPEAQALIEERARRAEEMPPIERHLIPGLAERISNRPIRLTPNRGSFESMTFRFETGRPDEADISFSLVGGGTQTCAIGLDNRYRISYAARPDYDVSDAPIATIHDFSTLYPWMLPAYTVGRKGIWRDETTFELQSEAFETGFRQQMTFRFSEAGVTVEAGILSYDDTFTFEGRWD